MSPEALSKCVQQAKEKGWNGGVMYWEWNSVSHLEKSEMEGTNDIGHSPDHGNYPLLGPSSHHDLTTRDAGLTIHDSRSFVVYSFSLDSSPSLSG